MNKRQSCTKDGRNEGMVGLGGTRIKESVTSNDGFRVGDVNMSVWDFGRKTRDEMNERTSSAILRRSKPRNGALREGRGAYSYLRQIDDLIFNDAGTAIRNNFHRNNHHDHVLYRVVVVGRHFLAPSLSPLLDRKSVV